MKIKSKPQPPIRRMDIEDNLGNVYFHDSVSLSDFEEHVRQAVLKSMSNYFNRAGLTLDSYKDIRISNAKYYDDPDSLEVIGIRDETDAEFKPRMAAYETRLANYEKWYLENKTAIEQELNRREVEKAQQEELAKQKAKEDRVKEITRLERKLKLLKNGNPKV